MIATLHAHPSQSNHDPKQLRQSGSGHLPHCFPSGAPPPQEAPGAPQSVQRLKRQPPEFQRQMKWQQATYQTLPNTVHRVATGVMKAASAGQPDSTATGGRNPADQAGRGPADFSLTGNEGRGERVESQEGQRTKGTHPWYRAADGAPGHNVIKEMLQRTQTISATEEGRKTLKQAQWMTEGGDWLYQKWCPKAKKLILDPWHRAQL